VLALALLACPVTVAAQTVSPTTPAHPSMPWSGITTPQGQLLRYIYVPPQPVMLEYVMPAPSETPAPAVEPAPPNAEAETKTAEKPPEPAPSSESPPPGPQIVRQQVIVPGYYVRETTVGFYYPDRWSIEQAAPNVYRWRQIPAQFIPSPAKLIPK
jgi:hypothetical protein